MQLMQSYWNARYSQGHLWGDEPCPSVVMAREWFDKHQLKDILVPGCGYGRNSLWLAQQGFVVTAHDVSEVAISLGTTQAKRERTSIEYMVGDAFDHEFMASRQFDGIYLSLVLHLFVKQQRLNLIDRLTSRLKSHGLLTFSCISIFDTHNFGIGKQIEPNTYEKHPGKPLHFFTEEELRDVLADNYKILACQLHTQTETDPQGQPEDLRLWFVVAEKS